MKTNQESSLAVVTVLAALAFGELQAQSQSVPGVPEPGVIRYGRFFHSV